ncbi:hypothetical protein BV22DRAFT_1134283 [Leucogyrophana mollusca]|uniref:Uncharacterized protein n=1 Tax=Leucogyrophana mollusca TaxID=85980 RepID=A0ACB8AZX6_9AGAM|nr:hypothetical protein BV22DRAFT_1134283 [Leucogyrophana mollusca]
MSAIILLHADKSNFMRAYRYKDDPKSPWVAATTSFPLPIKFGDRLIVKAILSDTWSWFFGTVTGVPHLEKYWVILELMPSREAYGQYFPKSPFLLTVLMLWTRLPPSIAFVTPSFQNLIAYLGLPLASLETMPLISHLMRNTTLLLTDG